MLSSQQPGGTPTEKLMAPAFDPRKTATPGSSGMRDWLTPNGTGWWVIDQAHKGIQRPSPTRTSTTAGAIDPVALHGAQPARQLGSGGAPVDHGQQPAWLAALADQHPSGERVITQQLHHRVGQLGGRQGGRQLGQLLRAEPAA